jgi:hypothetical protein
VKRETTLNGPELTGLVLLKVATFVIFDVPGVAPLHSLNTFT